ncbi:hypothetical protein [Prosthecochloris sp. ZM]|uniref:hypothetical protein n=1 Tax=Prosthecochloris sp. ZM TaxID=2283143 RepID=UPI0012948586|nr:hypothetical protein [Prosthecochloris sp. ZM]
MKYKKRACMLLAVDAVPGTRFLGLPGSEGRKKSFFLKKCARENNEGRQIL